MRADRWRVQVEVDRCPDRGWTPATWLIARFEAPFSERETLGMGTLLEAWYPSPAEAFAAAQAEVDTHFAELYAKFGEQLELF